MRRSSSSSTRRLEDDLAAPARPAAAELARLQEDALFTGEYDAGDALS